ncbi:MAG: glycoside hydrolase family 88 protein [Cyclobacteriaceae bacterium]
MRYILIILVVLIGCATPKQESVQTESKAKSPYDSVLDFSVTQYKGMSAAVPDSMLPRNFKDGELILSDTRWWTSGFFPGALVYLYEYSGDQSLRSEYENRFVHLEKEKLNTSDHDVGFKIQCSFGNALRITGDTAKYAPIIIQAAKSLVTRYDPEIGALKSWDWEGPMGWNYPVIVDNMMNLELLFVATQLSGDSIYYNVAMAHADKTIAHHFREDMSSYHVVSYNDDGTPEMKVTHQGYSDESAWARGQSWGLYGFTVCYKYTGEERYLEQAEGIAGFLLNHENLPEDKIPYWDFNASKIPNELRDASAGAIMAAALIQLSELTNKDQYLSAAKVMVNSLSSANYLAKLNTNGNFILEHSVGHLPGDSEVDVPLTYADYYFIESLMKLK